MYAYEPSETVLLVYFTAGIHSLSLNGSDEASPFTPVNGLPTDPVPILQSDCNAMFEHFSVSLNEQTIDSQTVETDGSNDSEFMISSLMSLVSWLAGRRSFIWKIENVAATFCLCYSLEKYQISKD